MSVSQRAYWQSPDGRDHARDRRLTYLAEGKTIQQRLLELLRSTNGGGVSIELICAVLWGDKPTVGYETCVRVYVCRFRADPKLKITRYKFGRFMGYQLHV